MRSDGGPLVAPPDVAWAETCAAGECELVTFAREACGPTQLALPSGCEPLDEPCASAPPAGAIVVDGMAPPGGDGTPGAPWRTVAEAVSAAGEGDTVWIAPGTYTEAVELAQGVRLEGACAERTILTTDVPSNSRAVVTVLGADPTLARLTIGPSVRPGIGLGDGGAVTLDRVRIRGVTVAGVIAQGASRVDGRRVAVEDIASVGGQYGHAIYAEGGAVVALEQVAIARAEDSAILALEEGSRVALTDATVRDTRSAVGGEGAEAATAQLDATVELTRVAVDDVAGRGLFAIAGGTIVARDVRVRGVLTTSDDGVGYAVHAQDRGVIDAERLVVTGAHGISLVAQAATLHVRDAWVADSMPGPNPASPGVGLVLRERANVTLERALLERQRLVGIGVDEESTLTLTDVAVRDVRESASDGQLGHGVETYATLVATRLEIVRARGAGLAVAGPLGSATVDDLRVSAIGSEAGGRFGFGVAVQEGATAQITRAQIEDTRSAAVVIDGDGTRLDLIDAAIARTRSEESNGGGGRGLTVQRGAHATALRVEIADSEGFGAIAIGAVLEADELTVRGVAPPACAATGCPTLTAGLAAQSGAAVVARGVTVESPGTCGLQVFEAELDVTRGRVSGASVGACVLVDGFDLGRVTADVVYEDNEIAVDAPVGPPAAPVAALE